LKLEDRQLEKTGRTKNQKKLLEQVHIHDQETGAAYIVEPRVKNQYGVYQ
jgi:hypothetical protein